jgi:hypothetical protein
MLLNIHFDALANFRRRLALADFFLVAKFLAAMLFGW